MEGWIVEIHEKLNNMADVSKEVEQWKKRSIYMLSGRVTDLNRKAYKPQEVAIGPYHHDEHHLKPMEEHKERALLHFIKRSAVPLNAYLRALEEVVQELKDAYDLLDPKWFNDTSAFLKLMILDGCFILEVLRMDTSRLAHYAPDDPIFSSHGLLYVLPFLRRDMLLLENQVPLLVLIKLLEVENGTPKQNENVNRLILRFFHSGPYSGEYLGKCLHLLDVYRKSLLVCEPRRSKAHCHRRTRLESQDMIPSASKLREARIRFKRTMSLKDISFKGNTLSLPILYVDGETKSKLLNLIAFERFHPGAGNEVTSYVFFLDNLVKDSKDVSLLCSSGIICNALGSDKDVAELFKLLQKDLVVDPESGLDEVYMMVGKNLSNRFQKRLHKWQDDLVRTYFRSPWAIVSVFAAILLFTLTIIQTVYTVLSYTHPK